MLRILILGEEEGKKSPKLPLSNLRMKGKFSEEIKSI